MRRWLHLFWNSIFLTIIGTAVWYYSYRSRLILIAVYAGIGFSLLPDIDAGTKYHRHFLTHSIIWIAAMWFVAWGYPELQLIISFWILGVGLHCLEDIRLNRASARGFYTIKIRQTISGKVKGLTGMGTTCWLFWNFVLSFIPMIITLWWLL